MSRHSTYQQAFGNSGTSTFVFYNSHNYHPCTCCNDVTAGGNLCISVLRCSLLEVPFQNNIQGTYHKSELRCINSFPGLLSAYKKYFSQKFPPDINSNSIWTHVPFLLHSYVNHPQLCLTKFHCNWFYQCIFSSFQKYTFELNLMFHESCSCESL